MPIAILGKQTAKPTSTKTTKLPEQRSIKTPKLIVSKAIRMATQPSIENIDDMFVLAIQLNVRATPAKEITRLKTSMSIY